MNARTRDAQHFTATTAKFFRAHRYPPPMTQLALLAAFGTALCWAVSPFLSLAPSKSHGAFAFVRARTICSAVMLPVVLVVWFAPAEWNLEWRHALIFAASGVLGITAGDAFYFSAIRRIGPRRAAMLFITNAPMSFLLAAILLGELPSLYGVLGCAGVIGGVVLAIRYGGAKGSFRSETGVYETTIGGMRAAVLLGLSAAVMQALGVVMVHGAALEVAGAGANPVLVSCIRVGAAALVFAPLPLLPVVVFRVKKKMGARFLARAALVGFLAMVVGITLLNFALAQEVDAGVVASIVATQPVLIVFIQWALTRRRPRAAAFAGAALAVGGVSLLASAA